MRGTQNDARSHGSSDSTCLVRGIFIQSNSHHPIILDMASIAKIIKEGQAQLQVPKTVFYNPVQEFNRDLSVLVLRAYLKHNLWHYKNEERFIKSRGGIKILDALSASGLRSIRFAKELGSAKNLVKSIVANDLSKEAVELIESNIKLNNVQDLVKSSHSDANHLMHESSKDFDNRFHIIDLDPFGTGAQFFDAAVKSVGEAGMIMITCTDTAVLCGNASESCFARYGCMSLRGEFCHDQALRIVLRSLEQHASVYGRYIKPLISVSVDFYVRLFVQVYTQQAETKKSASKLSQVYQCKECKTVELNKLGSHTIKDDPKQAASDNLAVRYKFKPADVVVGDRCRICSGRYTLGGPIWSAPIHDAGFLELLKHELAQENVDKEFKTYRRVKGLIHVCSEELAAPLLYSSTQMSSVMRIKVPRIRDIMSALVNAGYKVSSTHTNQNGFKTDAPSTVVWDIFCQVAEHQHDPESSKKLTNDALMKRVMSRPRDKTYDFTYNPAIESESQKLSLLRFQMNPAPEWGPMSRPVVGEKVDNVEADSQVKSKVESTESAECETEKDDNGSKRRKLT